MGQGVLIAYGPEMRPLPVINIDKLSSEQKVKLEALFDKMSKRKIFSIFNELGTNSPEEISIEKVQSDRRELDTYILHNILGLEVQDVIDVYKSIIDLVKSRIERAKTVTRRKKKKDVDVEALANNILSRLTTKIEKFPDAYLGDYKGLWSKEIKIPKGQPTFGSDINGFYVRIGVEEVYRGWDHDEAKFIYFAALTGASSVKLPLDKNALIAALEAFEKDYRKLKEEVNTLLSTLISDAKVRKEVEDKVWSLLFSRQGI
jgi:hypothetical protein